VPKTTLLLAALALGACESSVNLGDGQDAAPADAAPTSDASAGPEAAPSEAAPQQDAPPADAPAATCAQACDKLDKCGYLQDASPGECLAECTQQLTPDQIGCIVSTTCNAIPNACQGDAGDAFAVMACQAGCDKLNFFQCIDPTMYSSCRSLCTTVPALKRDTFAGCTQSSGADCTQGKGCYDELAR
jgi:hypothetical protein